MPRKEPPDCLNDHFWAPEPDADPILLGVMASNFSN